MSSPTVLVLFILILCSSSESCEMTEECPINNNVIWATNGTVCSFFRNECLLNNVNCHHQNNGEPTLKVITKDECQKLCVNKCPEEDDPVCGYYSDNVQQHTFMNKCEMEAYICKTGEPFFAYGIGPCELTDVKDEGEGVLSN